LVKFGLQPLPQPIAQRIKLLHRQQRQQPIDLADGQIPSILPDGNIAHRLVHGFHPPRAPGHVLQIADGRRGVRREGGCVVGAVRDYCLAASRFAIAV
jgi:hypothetical protein